MLTSLFSTGQSVLVEASGPRTLERTVVKDLGAIVLICKPDDFQRAQNLGIEPPYMAFRKENVKAAHA